MEKLLEDALIKVSAVASKIDAVSVRAMVEALIAGERDPQLLADLARGRMRAKHDARVEALTGVDPDGRIDTDRKTRNHIRQFEALGFRVTLQPAA